jgi:hypothetical protein
MDLNKNSLSRIQHSTFCEQSPKKFRHLVMKIRIHDSEASVCGTWNSHGMNMNESGQ